LTLKRSGKIVLAEEAKNIRSGPIRRRGCPISGLESRVKSLWLRRDLQRSLRERHRISLGYFLSVAVAIPSGIGMGWYKKLAYVFDPLVNA